MAKTLFFIEAIAFALLSIVFPLIATEATKAFELPVFLSLVLPLAGATAIWPPRSVIAALRAVLSTRRPEAGAGDSVLILEALVGLSRAAAVLGFLFAVVAVGMSAPLTSGNWSLLGIFLASYALLNAQLWSVLSAVASRLQADTGEAGPRDGGLAEARDIAATYGLTPREWETASLIAGGKSYKEAAFDLGISIRTVKAHMSRVYEKTGSGSNVGLVLLMRAERPSATKVQ